jgi:glycerol transport system ATP-binding protein
LLELRGVSKAVEGAVHIAAIDLVLERGSLNVLLGPTGSGKTSLLRLMAGLDRPTAGRILFDGKDVTGHAVQRRNVAMVYQQFVNYPSMTVFDNIASPLRLKWRNKSEIEQAVRQAAELLKLTPYLDRTPLNLSGGQQQRTALARAIVKSADLVLLDEPLANLDYKLREELREELPSLFARTGAILVYATTEPSEALLLGGKTATLHQGNVTQFGPTLEVFRRPRNLITAATFADPPLNTAEAAKVGTTFDLGSGLNLPAPKGLADGFYVLGLQPHHLSLIPAKASAPLPAQVLVTELTGSESFVHVDIGGQRWVSLSPGLHDLEPGAAITVHVDPAHLMVFGQAGEALAA